MVRQYSGSAATFVVTTIAVLLILLLSSTGQTMRESYALATPPRAPSWLLPGDYIEYNQTYTIGGLTASINVKDAVIGVNGAADLRIQRFGPQVPNGFPEPGLVAPYDSSNNSKATVSFANGTVRTDQGSSFTTDLTMFVDQDLLARTNATLESLHVSGSGSPTVQAWRVDESVLYRFIGAPGVPPGAAVSPSLVWFEKDTLTKVRESANYTDPSHNLVVSVEAMEDTNIPQLKSALTSQASYSSQSSSLSSSTTSATVQSPNYTLEEAALVAVVVVAVTAMASYFVKASRRKSLVADPGRTRT